MQLIYFRGKQQNFGDDLNAELWPRLLPGLFAADHRAGFLGIGTIIGMNLPSCDSLDIFSSGAGYARLDDWHPGRRVWCVRGPLTAQLLGCSPDVALTDGAILAPELFNEAASDPGGHIGVVPHWESLHFPGWTQTCEQAGMRLITPIDTPANVIRGLRSCRLVLTESLHGAILADALDIPWIPFISTRNVSAFKWVDWCLSVGLTFAPVTISPPSVNAALHFGRPDQMPRDQPRAYDAEAALAEYRGRLNSAAAPAPGRVRALLLDGARRAASHGTVLGRAMGFHPGRTAAALRRAADLPPALSRRSLRVSLRDRMMDRLYDLARDHAVSREPANVSA